MGNHSIGATLYGTRIRQRLTLGKVAAAAGISISTLSAIEHDETGVSIAVLARIAAALGLNVGDLAWRWFAREAGDEISALVYTSIVAAHERFSAECFGLAEPLPPRPAPMAGGAEHTHPCPTCHQARPCACTTFPPGTPLECANCSNCRGW